MVKMIEIVIPTLNRLDKQITLSNIPDEYKLNTTLVVQPHEAEQAKKVHSNIFILSDNNIGMSNTIKEITYEWSIVKPSKFWIMDDDLTFIYNDLENEKWKQKIGLLMEFYMVVLEQRGSLHLLQNIHIIQIVE